MKVAEGLDVSLFATSSSANYPVYVAAAPSGDLYVSSDGNGSLGRDPKRGRVLRLRDTDKDGRADQVTEFVSDVDSPRGLVWDHDRLYLIHPPDVSVYIDKNGDGVADEEKTLIKGIAFGFKDRPADHTTNGLSLGIDGWLYIAGGDFGFKDAVGSDGRHLQSRGGGVIRFRPDGSGLEMFSYGTRNILGTPISPLLDLFARDNTNDGGGWDVAFIISQASKITAIHACIPIFRMRSLSLSPTTVAARAVARSIYQSRGFLKSGTTPLSPATGGPARSGITT